MLFVNGFFRAPVLRNSFVHLCFCDYQWFFIFIYSLELLTDEGIHSSLILGIHVSCVPGSKIVSSIAMVIVITWS